MEQAGYFRYWGKASREEGGVYHLLPYHCLDVAAVGVAMMRANPTMHRWLAALVGRDEPRFLSWLLFFLSIHDLGKFAEGFQGQRPELLERLQGRETTKRNIRHDHLGYLFWEEVVWGEVWERDLLRLRSGGGDPFRWEEALRPWAAAALGHHGTPPGGESLILQRHLLPENQDAAMGFVLEVAALFVGDAPLSTPPLLPDLLAEVATPASWWLAGLVVLCDWLGSGEGFAYRDDPMPLDRYWRDHALPQAERSVAEAGLRHAEVAKGRGWRELFPEVNELYPLQRTAWEQPLREGPQLFVIEDLTGAGKTEAALLLAYRLMAVGAGEGAYVALPTMATANAMYDRMATAYRGLYADGSEPSLILAHGGRSSSEAFQASLRLRPRADEADYGEERSASARCSEWLGDGRKKALLGEMGVGTIDQALLAVLHSRHQSLRLLGLGRKVLIVDEVHACDAYMLRLLRELLRFHARAGGSAILLSATLPRRMRLELMGAFAEGAGGRLGELREAAYPLLSHWSAEGGEAQPFPARADKDQRIETRLFHDEAEVAAFLSGELAAGRCACWIRNTVDGARETYQRFAERLPEGCVQLFHARYAMGDRLDIEGEVLERFGKKSRGDRRRGRLLIATQVVEQSLDLDFDAMVSDLAPIDLLIQRAGRLHRHRRDQDGNPNDEERRPPAVLHVLTPPPVDAPGDDWLGGLFPKGGGIYPDHGRLWLTARLLDRRGGWRLTEDARLLIEGVYGDEAEVIPDGLQRSAQKARGEEGAKRSVAEVNLIDLDGGYVYANSPWWDEAITPTRLGEATIALYLARWEEGRLRPWRHRDRLPWATSRLNVRERMIKEIPEPADPDLRRALEAAKETLPGKGKWGLLLPLTEEGDGGWRGEALDGKGRPVVVRYQEMVGLWVGNN